jgi:hypothetical protein
MWGVLLVLLYFALALAAAVVILQPDRLVVRRAAVIDASAEAVFRQINDLHNWRLWSPWTTLDPAARLDYSGAQSGEGAALEWRGGGVGAGRIAILDSLPSESVTLKLDLFRPLKTTSAVYFTLTPDADTKSRTLVDWSLVEPGGLVHKAVNLLTGREKRLGALAERGLADLQRLCAGRA